MPDRPTVELRPLGKSIRVNRGSLLRDILFPHGVEFPCGGQGTCRACRVRVLAGSLEPTALEQRSLTAEQLEEGWRLACCSKVSGDLVLEVAQWSQPVLSDDSPFPFTPREGLGIAVDVGTTTLALQLLDGRTGRVLGVESALNPQAVWGADIMHRLSAATDPEVHRELQRLIRSEVGSMVARVLTRAGVGSESLVRVSLVGNTVMHHLFCGCDLAPLTAYPFESPRLGRQVFGAEELGWLQDAAERTAEPGPEIEFLPCLGGFIGSDILAGILATRLHESRTPAALIDLGTNGEIAIGESGRVWCASTAAGPAFEGARLSMGMRAAAGAISEVRLAEKAGFECRVLGGIRPRGICGSGLVDAAAAGLEAGLISPSGRLLAASDGLTLMAPVRVTQGDIRELQLAKAAVAAGMLVLLEQMGAAPDDLATIHVAGAFGNYVNPDSARRIGLLPPYLGNVRPSGNTALLGAKMALCGDREDVDYRALRQRVTHVSLAADPAFNQAFVDALPFPGR